MLLGLFREKIYTFIINNTFFKDAFKLKSSAFSNISLYSESSWKQKRYKRVYPQISLERKLKDKSTNYVTVISTKEEIVVGSLSHVWFSATPWTAATQASLFFTITCSLLNCKSIESMMPFNHLILCCSLLYLLSILASIKDFPSIRVFSALHIRLPKFWGFTFSISPSNEYSVLISFKIDWFDFLIVQGTLKCLLQHHNLKASILQGSAFFMVQVSYLYMTTGKTIILTVCTFIGKMMSFLFNTLSRFVIAFFPRSKCLLISRLHSPSTMI